MTQAKSKTLDTLVEDIYNLFENDTKVNVDDEVYEAFGKRMAALLKRRLTEIRSDSDNTLRMSTIGRPSCQLWFTAHMPEKAEELSPKVKFKFLYGDILEEVVLELASIAGHTVTGQQDEIEVEGIIGHRDAVIDGVLCDVKSASPFAFRKFSEGSLVFDDSFGYRDQLAGYLHGSGDDVDKTKAAFIAVDKTTGGICVDVHDILSLPDVRGNIGRVRKAIHADAPVREFEPVADGKSGNMKLGVTCSYCRWKNECWKESNHGEGLRTFLYSNGPRFLTTVKNEPNVVEVDKDGTLITE